MAVSKNRRAPRRLFALLAFGAVIVTGCPPGTTITFGEETTTTEGPTTTVDPANDLPPTINSFSAVKQAGGAPLTTAFQWSISDPNGTPSLCQLDTDSNGTPDITVTKCTSASVRAATFTTIGSQTVTLTISDGYNPPVSATTVVSVSVPSSDQFAITVRLNGTMTPAQQATFTTAANRWSQVIRTGLANGNLNIPADDCGTGAPAFNGAIDDVLIDATIAPIDGAGAILGQAGPCYTRITGGLPIYGVMKFDIADVAGLEADGDFAAVILHEMGHVLGFGTVWDFPLLSAAGTSNPVFTGLAAKGAWQAIGGNGSVPVENSGGPGTADSHWRESTFNGELMTGYIDAGANPLSAVTIAALSDMGYGVDLGAADPYGLPGLLAGPPALGRQIDIDPVVPKGAVSP